MSDSVAEVHERGQEPSTKTMRCFAPAPTARFRGRAASRAW